MLQATCACADVMMSAKHESVCCVCKMYPIIGFRSADLSLFSSLFSLLCVSGSCAHSPSLFPDGVSACRYKNMSCMDRDVCQECFWTGKEGNGHKNSHELREYCFAVRVPLLLSPYMHSRTCQSTAREDTKDFFGRIKRKFQRKKKLQAEDSAFGPLALPGPSGQPVSTRADVGVDAAKTRGEDLDTIHLEYERCLCDSMLMM